MVHAVRVPARNAIYFVMGEPVTKPGWTVEPGAWLDVPININDWPLNMPRPEQVLCRDVEDKQHYKVFKYRDEIEPELWEQIDLNFGGTFSTSSWNLFAQGLPSLRPPVAPDNTQVMDEVLHRIQGKS